MIQIGDEFDIGGLGVRIVNAIRAEKALTLYEISKASDPYEWWVTEDSLR